MELERYVRDPERREHDIESPQIGEVQNVYDAILDAPLPQLLSCRREHIGRRMYRKDLVTDLEQAAGPVPRTAT